MPASLEHKDFGTLICRIADFKASGLSTFQAMATAFEDDDFDRVYGFFIASTTALAQYVVDGDHAAMLRAARKLTAFAAGHFITAHDGDERRDA